MKKISLINQKIFTLVAFLVFAYCGLGLLLRLGQERLIFFPSSTLKETPADVHLNYEEVWIPVTQSGKSSQPQQQLYGWWIPVEANKPVLLYLHGNSGNIGDLLEETRRFHQLGLSVLLIDYRGYGRSKGKFPNETQVYEDAESALNYLITNRHIPAKNIFLYGHAIGGAIAIETAIRHPIIAGVIVESSFTSMKDMADYIIPLQIYPKDWILTQQFNSLAKVKSLKVPVLFLHGTKDKTMSPLMSRELYLAAPQPKYLLLIRNAKHDDVAELGRKNYLHLIQFFIERFHH